MKAITKRLIKVLLYGFVSIGLITIVIPLMTYIMFGIDYIEFMCDLIDDNI